MKQCKCGIAVDDCTYHKDGPGEDEQPETDVKYGYVSTGGNPVTYESFTSMMKRVFGYIGAP